MCGCHECSVRPDGSRTVWSTKAPWYSTAATTATPCGSRTRATSCGRSTRSSSAEGSTVPMWTSLRGRVPSSLTTVAAVSRAGRKSASPMNEATNRVAGRSNTTAGEPSCSIAPSRITTTWSPTASASVWSWVTSTAVVPVRRTTSRVSARTWPRSPSSRLENGSSSSRTFGRGASARARASRCCSPPESSCGYRPARWPSRTSSSMAATRSRRSRRGTALRPNATLRATSRWGNNAWSWKTRPTLRRSGWCQQPPPATVSPAMAIRPASGRSSPAMSRRSVDLPQPLGPITATTDPDCTATEMPRTAVTPPKAFFTPVSSSAVFIGRPAAGGPPPARWRSAR